jgi:hypothetical protein
MSVKIRQINPHQGLFHRIVHRTIKIRILTLLLKKKKIMINFKAANNIIVQLISIV